MHITVSANLHYEAAQACEILLHIEGASGRFQRCVKSQLTLTPDPGSHLFKGQDGIGSRRWVNETSIFKCQYDAIFEIDRPQHSLRDLESARVSTTPAQVTHYLLPSRYCHPEAFYDFLTEKFADVSGGPLVLALCQWISENFRYDNSVSTGGTTATDSFAARAGVCRDYAHVLIAMVRAAGIPARYVSAYAPDVSPQDFHAVAEVFLGGAWHMIDPTGMAQPSEIIRIGVGRDAADVSFLTSYGLITLINQTVEVSRNVIEENF